MSATKSSDEKYSGEEPCDHDWCDGPESDTLPCFDCFDRYRTYELGGAK